MTNEQTKDEEKVLPMRAANVGDYWSIRVPLHGAFLYVCGMGDALYEVDSIMDRDSNVIVVLRRTERKALKEDRR